MSYGDGVKDALAEWVTSEQVGVNEAPYVSRIQKWLAEQTQKELDAHVRPEIQALAKRGNVASEEIAEMRCNSWEWEHLTPALDDKAFIERFRHALHNCGVNKRPCSTYNEAVESLYAPELLRRFEPILQAMNLGNPNHGIPRTIRFALWELVRIAHAAWEIQHLVPHPDDQPQWSRQIREFKRAIQNIPPLDESIGRDCHPDCGAHGAHCMRPGCAGLYERTPA